MVEHRALVDRPLVGDFAAVDRERRIEQERADNPRRGAGRCRLKRGKALPEGAAHQRILRADGDVVSRQSGIDQAATVEIEHDESSDVVTVDPGDHDVAHQRRAGCDEAGAQRADADPGAACEFEILGDAAIEVETGRKIVRDRGLGGIAEFVKPFLIEGGQR